MKTSLNAGIGWGLGAVGIAAGYVGWGWPGVALGVTVLIFWLLLQFSRSLRVLQQAGRAPMGQVDNALMLHSRLRAGMTLMQVLGLTRSLGQRISESPECWAWADPGGAGVHLVFAAGKLQSWQLTRPAEAPAAGDTAP